MSQHVMQNMIGLPEIAFRPRLAGFKISTSVYYLISKEDYEDKRRQTSSS